MKESTRLQLTKTKGNKTKDSKEDQIEIFLKFKRNIYDKDKKMLQ